MAGNSQDYRRNYSQISQSGVPEPYYGDVADNQRAPEPYYGDAGVTNQQHAGCSRDNIRFVIRLFSILVATWLIIITFLGFKTIAVTDRATTLAQVESTTTTGCLSFLGLWFGILLLFGETRWERFFINFGFMRYRAGRATVYTLVGVMTIAMGRSYDEECECTDFFPLIVLGSFSIVSAIVHILAMFLLERNTAPMKTNKATRGFLQV